MEQFVLVPASVYNKSVTTQSVTKQELPKYKAEQPPTYQIDSLERDTKKKVCTDNLIDKILSCSRIKLSNSQTIILNGVDTGVLISDVTLHLRRKTADVPDIYFTLLNAAGMSPCLVFNQNAKAKDRGSWVTFKVWSQKLQRVYTQGAAAYGSVRTLTKASRLPVSKVRQFLHSKACYTKFTLAARKFKRMRAFARFRNEIWCMDLAYVDKLAKENNGEEYLLVRQDLSDRTVNAKGMKTKDSQETVKSFSSMITKRNRPKKISVDKGTEFAGAFKKFCAAEGIQVYSTICETKAAFAERTIRSLKSILYRYMEDFGYKYIHKLPQFITTLNCRRNSSIDMRPNTVKNCDFMSILYSKPLREFKKPTLKIGDRVRISKNDLPFRKSYKPQFTREVFEIVAIATRKPPTCTIKDEQREVIQGKFLSKRAD